MIPTNLYKNVNAQVIYTRIDIYSDVYSYVDVLRNPHIYAHTYKYICTQACTYLYIDFHTNAHTVTHPFTYRCTLIVKG